MKLLTCIAFHFKTERLMYLRQVLHAQQFLADSVHVIVTTNTAEPNELAAIRAVSPASSRPFSVEIESFTTLPNPYLLTWAHKVVLARHMGDMSYTHFMYTEDDLELTENNVAYWLRTRELLRPFGFYPSFFRVEWNETTRQWCSTDIEKPVSVAGEPKVLSTFGDYQFLNLPNPYQGLFFYDRELMAEHAASHTFDLTKYGRLEKINMPSGGGTTERATYGLTYVNIPEHYRSRNLVPYFCKFLKIDPDCWVHHLPNNYANGKAEIKLGKLRVDDVLCE
jgi:hypothetical protein